MPEDLKIAADQNALAAAEQLLRSNLVDTVYLKAVTGEANCYPEEFLDLLRLMEPEQQIGVFGLFDRRYYVKSNPDVATSGIDPFVHFLTKGIDQLRSPHPLVDLNYILMLRRKALGSSIDLSEFIEVIEQNICDPGPYFSISDYIAMSDAAVPQGTPALVHFLQVGGGCGARPNRYLDPAYYASRFDDVPGPGLAAVLHFVRVGDKLGRRPSEDFDPTWYRRQFADVCNSPPLMHFLSIGRDQGRKPRARGPMHGDAGGLFESSRGARTPRGIEPALLLIGERILRTRAEAVVPAYAKRPLEFTVSGSPEVSAVVVANDDPVTTLISLSSLRANSSAEIDLVLVLSGTGWGGAAADLARFVRGANLVRLGPKLGSLASMLAGLAVAAADIVLLLDGAMELMHGALANALSRLRSDHKIGAVAAKVLRPDGLLAEAGSIIGEDGTIGSYLEGASALKPEGNFLRDIDCSRGAFLLMRRSLLPSLEGLDDYRSRDYGIADLCIRLHIAGNRIVYDPAVVVHQMCQVQQKTDVDVGHSNYADQEIFKARYSEILDGQGSKSSFLSRFGLPGEKRILFIEDMLPLRILGSGFVRSNDLIQTMAELGHQVTVYPSAASQFDLGVVYSDMPDTAEVMHDRSIVDLPEFLEERAGFYDTVWIARTHNLDGIVGRLSSGGGLPSGPKYVLDTEAIVCLRDEAKTLLAASSTTFDREEAWRREFRNAALCQDVVAVSDAEAAMLREHLGREVAVIGHARAYTPTPRSYQDRKGLALCRRYPRPRLAQFRWPPLVHRSGPAARRAGTGA